MRWVVLQGCMALTCAAPPPASPQAEWVPQSAVPQESNESLCSLVESHNTGMLKQASSRAAERLEALGMELEQELDSLREKVDQEGRVEVDFPSRGRVRLASLSESELHVAAALPGTEASQYRSSQERFVRLDELYAALRARQPLPKNLYETTVDWCVEDERGAWAIWLAEAAYAPDASDISLWYSRHRQAVVRLAQDGAVTSAQSFPHFFDSPTLDQRFASPDESNCCYSSRNQGVPQVVFIHDQNRDGVPELALQALYASEGAFERTSVVYRFSDGRIEEYTDDFDRVEDVDGDGRLDLVRQQWVEVGEDCGSGFPASYQGLPHVMHARPDGTYSADDAVAKAYTQKQCPDRPSAFGTPEQIWCGKVWQVDEEEIGRGILAACRADVCSEESSKAPCAWLQAAQGAFAPPVRW